jgi:hypothetical protein
VARYIGNREPDVDALDLGVERIGARVAANGALLGSVVLDNEKEHRNLLRHPPKVSWVRRA